MNEEKGKEIYDIGEMPPLGTVPKKMHAWTIREERLGEPINAFQDEIVDVPKVEKDELLIYNMAAGLNYNGVWAALGKPRNVIKGHNKYDRENVDFHICGSESSGIVYAVGENVTKFKVGDHVIIGGNQYDDDDPELLEGVDSILVKSFRIWGYEANWGAFAQFSRVHENQLVKKPDSIDWVKAATLGATAVTAYRMLIHYEENKIKPGDVVLIWGGSGGIGSMAIQLVKYFGGIPVAVVSSEERGKTCIELGAKGYINRKNYTHWGLIDQDYKDMKNQRLWLREALRFRKEIWKIVGEKKDPAIVFEHSGEDTRPTSLFVCKKGGMVVLCGATSGYIGAADLRYLWLEQKRIQGSHAGTIPEFEEVLKIVEEGHLSPIVSNVYDYWDLAKAHQLMHENKASIGKNAVKIGME